MNNSQKLSCGKEAKHKIVHRSHLCKVIGQVKLIMSDKSQRVVAFGARE